MNQQQTLTAFCEIGHMVQEAMGYKVPADCFCDQDMRHNPGFQYSGEIVDFIRNAVQEALRVPLR